MKKVLPVLNLALKALEIVSASKQKLYICNQKGLKLLLTKNPYRRPFRLNAEEIHDQLLHFHFFFCTESMSSDTTISSSLPPMPNLLSLKKF